MPSESPTRSTSAPPSSSNRANVASYNDASHSFTDFETYVNALAFAPDGKRVLCSSGHYLYDKLGRILTETGWVDHQVVLIEQGRITQIVAQDAPWNAQQRYDLRGRLLLPGFIDTQVNAP